MEPSTRNYAPVLSECACPKGGQLDCFAHALLRDGRELCVRPMEPSDAVRLQAFHERLSRETTRLRFFSPLRKLNDKMATQFAEVDFENRCAFVGHLPGEPETIRAVGRYERDAAHSAEVAFVVEDELQGLGVGQALLELLARHARTHGITRLTAVTLAENRAMLGVFRESGYPADVAFDGEVAHVRIDIRDRTKDGAARRGLAPGGPRRD